MTSKKNKKIFVLQGGKNEEHEISIKTGKEVYKALLKLGYNVETFNVYPKNFKRKINILKPDCCFNALHGPFGEDGQIQRILFDLKIPYTHSGIGASIKSFDKFKTKICLKNSEINILNSKVINKDKINKTLLTKLLVKYNSLVIKPLCSGSSYGVKIIRKIKDIEKLLKNNFARNKLYLKHKYLIIEPYIEGRELTVTVIDRKKTIFPVGVTEILSKSNFFDYKTKYTKGLSKHILPASLPKSTYNQCLKHAKIVHKILGCKGVSRSDFIFDDNSNKLYFLEINTQPGLTPVSLVPEQLNYKGISFLELIDSLIKLAKCRK